MTMEQNFVIEKNFMQIPCRLCVPDCGEIRRVVLGVHGFGGSMEDEIQAGIAEEMELFYSATLRFDFPAHGINRCDDLTLRGCMDTLMAAAEEAKKRFPEVEDLCIFASGFGAYVTLICLEELVKLPGRVKLVVQTPSVRMHETLLSMMGTNRETLWAMEVQRTRSSKRVKNITYRFYEELSEHMAIVTYPIPMLILHGESDAYIRSEDIQSLHRLNEDSKLVIIPGTSHRFLEEGAWDMVLDLTRDWFEFEQVLLADWE